MTGAVPGWMGRSRLGEGQVVAMLRGQEAGVPTTRMCREHGVGSATFYECGSEHGGASVSDARRAEALEGRNAALGTPLAERMLDDAMLRDVIADQW